MCNSRSRSKSSQGVSVMLVGASERNRNLQQLPDRPGTSSATFSQSRASSS